MRISHRVAFGVAAIWANRLVGALLGLVLIPVLFRNLPQEELGLWFVIAQAGAFVGLLDFGFNATLTRRLAMTDARAGAAPAGHAEHGAELDDLLATGRALYRWIGVAVLVIGFGSGVLFLGSLPLEHADLPGLLRAWVVLCFAYAITGESGHLVCALNAAGHVGWVATVSALSVALTTGAQIVVALAGGGLFELSLTAAAGALLTRLGLGRVLAREAPAFARRTGKASRDMVRDMSGLALRSWLTAFGGFLILKTDQYFIAYYRGAADVPAYHAAYQLVANCYFLAVAFSSAADAFVSRLWESGDLVELRRLVWRSVRLGLGLMVSAVAFLSVCGESVIELWLGPGNFVGTAVLATFCIMLTLEAQHVIMASACRATEDEAFAPWAIGAGILNLALTWALIGPLGLWGVALATMIAQLATNNWYALWRSLRRLRMPAREYARRAVFPVAVLLAGSSGAGFAAAWVGRRAAGEVGAVVAAAIVVGAVMLVFWWFVALDDGDRHVLRRGLRELRA